MRLGLADMLPPILMHAINRNCQNHNFFGDYPTWEAALADAAPYQTDLNAYGAITERIRRGEATSGRNLMPILAGVLLGGGKVIDYGGNLGFIYFEVARLMASRIEWWRIVDLPRVVDYGNAHLADGKLAFFDAADKALDGGAPDVVICSHTLQILVEPYATLTSLLEKEPEILILHELPVGRERIMIQRLPPALGGGAFPARILSEAKLDDATSRYKMIAEMNLPAWAPFEGVRQVARLYKRKAV